MFKRMRNKVRLAVVSDWDLTFDRLDLVLTEEDILGDLASVPRRDSSTIDKTLEPSA